MSLLTTQPIPFLGEQRIHLVCRLTSRKFNTSMQNHFKYYKIYECIAFSVKRLVLCVPDWCKRQARQKWQRWKIGATSVYRHVQPFFLLQYIHKTLKHFMVRKETKYIYLSLKKNPGSHETHTSLNKEMVGSLRHTFKYTCTWPRHTITWLDKCITMVMCMSIFIIFIYIT